MGYLPLFYINGELSSKKLANYIVEIPDYMLVGLNLEEIGDFSVKDVATLITSLITDNATDKVFVGDVIYEKGKYHELQIMLIDSAPQKFIIDFGILMLISDIQVGIDTLHTKTMSVRLVNYLESLCPYADELREYYDDLPFREALTKNKSLDLKTEVSLFATNSLLTGLKVILPTESEVNIDLPTFLWTQYLQEIAKMEDYKL